MKNHAVIIAKNLKTPAKILKTPAKIFKTRGMERTKQTKTLKTDNTKQVGTVLGDGPVRPGSHVGVPDGSIRLLSHRAHAWTQGGADARPAECRG